MSDQPTIGDFDVHLTLGDRPVTLKYSIRNALALSDGVGLAGLAQSLRVQELRAMARIIQIGCGGKYDDHGPNEPMMTIEDIAAGMYQAGVHMLSIGPLDDYLWYIMFNKPKGNELEAKKKPDPQPKP